MPSPRTHAIQWPRQATTASERSRIARRVVLRGRIYLLQAISFTIDGAVVLFYFTTGGPTLSIVALCSLSGVAVAGLASILSWMHFNDRFEDHFFTTPIALAYLTIELASIHLAPNLGFYFVCIFFIILAVCSLRMTTVQACLIWTFGIVGLGFVFMTIERPIGLPMSSPAERAIALLGIASVMGRCAVVGLYGSSLRQQLVTSHKSLERANERIAELADIDELTCALNRRCIGKKLDDELHRARDVRRPLAVAMIDLDHFKQVNDGFGHPVGDEVLRLFVATVSINMRETDLLGRYGGEEFVLVLPGALEEQAFFLVDRLRGIVAGLNWGAIGDNLVVTMSAGTACLREDDTAESLLARADAGLYRAKGCRNCVATVEA